MDAKISNEDENMYLPKKSEATAGMETCHTDDDKNTRTQRRHFFYKTCSSIFSNAESTEYVDNSSNSTANMDATISNEDENMHLPKKSQVTAGMETCHSDDDMNKRTQRRHFPGKTNSSIFSNNAESTEYMDNSSINHCARI